MYIYIYIYIRELKDVVFKDVVFDNDSFVTLLYVVFIVTSMSNLLLSNTTSLNSRYICRWRKDKEGASLRPTLKSSTWKIGPRPWEIWTFKGYAEVKISNGSGILRSFRPLRELRSLSLNSYKTTGTWTLKAFEEHLRKHVSPCFVTE